MAEDNEMVKNIKEGLKCSICLETYTNPKQLQCHHVFCYECVSRLVVTDYSEDRQHPYRITCPNCRKVTSCKRRGGEYCLESAFHVGHFLKIVSQHRKSAEKASWCSAHPHSKSDLYCETCSVLICCKCAVKGGKHFNHDYREHKEAFEAYKVEIASTVVEMEECLATVSDAVTELKKCRSEISNQCTSIYAKLDETARKLKKAIDSKKNELATQLRQITEKKLKDLSVQISGVKLTQAHFSSNLHSLKQMLGTVNYGEVLKTKEATLEQAKQLISSFQSEGLKPTVKADVLFSTAPQHRELLQCRATGEGLHTAVVGEPSEITVTASSLDGGRCKDLTGYIVSELVPATFNEDFDCDWTGGGVRVCMEQRSPDFSEYRFSYTPITEGWHQLHVRVGGQHIYGSPFRVEVKPLSSIAVKSSVVSSLKGETVPGEEYSLKSPITVEPNIASNSEGESISGEELLESD